MSVVNPDYPVGSLVRPLDTDTATTVYSVEYFIEYFDKKEVGTFDIQAYSSLEAQKMALDFCKENGLTFNKMRVK